MKGKSKKTSILCGIAAFMFVVSLSAKAESNGVQNNAKEPVNITLGRPTEGLDGEYKAPAGANVVFFKQSNGKVVVLTLTELTPEQQAQLQADLFASHKDPSIKEDDEFFYIVGEGTYNLKVLLDDKAWGTEYVVTVSEDGIITIKYQDGKISHYTPFCVVTPTPTLSPSPTPTPTPEITPTPTPEITPTPTPEITPTPTPEITPTPTPEITPTPTPEITPTPTPEITPTPTPEITPTPTPEITPTPTPEITPTPTPEITPTPTPFITPTPELTNTPELTTTPVVTPPEVTPPQEPPKTGSDISAKMAIIYVLGGLGLVTLAIPSSKFEGRRRVRK